MIKNFKEVITKYYRIILATLTYAEPGLTEEDYVYLNSIIFNTEDTKDK